MSFMEIDHVVSFYAALLVSLFMRNKGSLFYTPLSDYEPCTALSVFLRAESIDLYNIYGPISLVLYSEFKFLKCLI